MYFSTSKKANASVGNATFLQPYVKLLVSEILILFAKAMQCRHNKWDTRLLAMNHVMLAYSIHATPFL